MTGDERRAEIEAVAYVLHEAPPEADLANVARECIAALDRVRDARGKRLVCSQCGTDWPDGYCEHADDDPVWVRDARGDTVAVEDVVEAVRIYDGPINASGRLADTFADFILAEFGARRIVAARPPQGEEANRLREAMLDVLPGLAESSRAGQRLRAALRDARGDRALDAEAEVERLSAGSPQGEDHETVMREKVARVLAIHAAGDEDEWSNWLAVADAALMVIEAEHTDPRERDVLIDFAAYLKVPTPWAGTVDAFLAQYDEHPARSPQSEDHEEKP